jgi:hypothetical protein
MRPSVIPHFLWALIAVIAFALGYFAGDRPPAGPSTGMSSAASSDRNALSTDTAASSANFATRLVTPEPRPQNGSVITAENARLRAFEALASPDKFERMRHLCDVLAQVTTENWREVMKGLLRRATTQEGVRADEWNLALEQIGRIAGPAALEETLGSPNLFEQERAQGLLIGFADSNPKMAREWFDAQPPQMQERLLDSLLTGLGRSEPAHAIAIALTRPPPTQGRLVPAIVGSVVERGGFTAADSLLSSIVSRADLSDQDKRNVFWAIAQKKIAISKIDGDPFAAATWLESYLGNAYVGPAALKDILSLPAQTEPTRTIDRIDAHGAALAPEQSQLGWQVIAQAWRAKAPEEFTRWIDANPTHPQHDRMAEATAQDLLRGGHVDDARNWVARIVDDTMRKRVEQMFQQ